MVVAVIGTHGAGKSTLVARMVRLYQVKQSLYAQFTVRPAITACRHDGVSNLAVIGDYINKPYSGIDSGRFSGHLDWAFNGMGDQDKRGWNILVEGMVLIGAWRRLVALKRSGHEVRVVCLSPPIEECVAGLVARKAGSRNKSSKLPVNMDMVRQKCDDARKAVGRLRASGISVDVLHSRATAEYSLEKILGWRE